VLKEMVCQVRGIKDGVPYALYEMSPTGEERYLEEDECVLELIAYWQRLFDEDGAGDAGDAGGGGGGGKRVDKKAVAGLGFYRVVFKVHMYFDPPADDAAAQAEMYVQAVYDVVSARYPCADADLRALAALQLQAECGDAGLPELREHLPHFFPAKALPKAGTAAAELFLSDLRRQHAGHAGKSAAAAAAEYLRTVRSWQVYGSSFFLVERQNSADLPADVFLAVSPKGVLVINPETRATLAFHPYQNVPTWGHSGHSFVLHVGSQAQQTKLYFNTPDGKEINDLIRGEGSGARPMPSGSRPRRAAPRPLFPLPRNLAAYVNFLCTSP
jgi:hypothetical protein